MKKALVIGSLNMDMTVKMEKLPKKGETIFGLEYYESCGGKGANQAVAISKLGMDTEMIGMVGNDEQGKKLIENLKKHNVKTENIFINKNSVTGKAFINVEDSGSNNIIVIPGSNFEIFEKEIDEKINSIKETDFVILQNEIPLKTVEYILEKSKKENKITIYNPAPAKKINDKMLQNSDYLILNETEMEEIFEININDNNFVQILQNIKKEKKIKNIILTLGKKGSILFDENNIVNTYGAYNVKAVDTTAAGDSFLGGFIYKLSESNNKDEAIKYATAVSALVVTKKGAQESIPSKEEIEKFIRENKEKISSNEKIL